MFCVNGTKRVKVCFVGTKWTVMLASSSIIQSHTGDFSRRNSHITELAVYLVLLFWSCHNESYYIFYIIQIGNKASDLPERMFIPKGARLGFSCISNCVWYYREGMTEVNILTVVNKATLLGRSTSTVRYFTPSMQIRMNIGNVVC